MIIYEKVKRFDPITGKPTEKWAQKELRCDYTGVVLDYDNNGPTSYCSYYLDYEDHDPCFGSSGAEYEFGKEFDIDMFHFLSKTYHFFQPGLHVPWEFAEFMMMKEAIENCENKKSAWYRCFTFDSICRQARINTARKLMDGRLPAKTGKDGLSIIKPEHLEGNQ